MSRQRGATLVELLVAMAVTSVILLALAGVSGVAQSVIQRWLQPSLNTQSANRLGTWLDHDSRLYVPCQGNRTTTLGLCDGPDVNPVVTYGMDAGNLTRTVDGADGTPSTTALIRGTVPVSFTYGCSTSGTVTTGLITAAAGARTLAQVAFRLPKTESCR